MVPEIVLIVVLDNSSLMLLAQCKNVINKCYILLSYNIFSVTAVGSPAQDPNDYTAPNPVLTFVAGESNNRVRNIIIPLTDDGIFELDEDIIVILSAGSDDKVTVNPPVQATVTISDDDGTFFVKI